MVVTRMGDGSFITLTADEVRRDVEEGVQDAVSRGKIPPLSAEEVEILVAICSRPQKFVSVQKGNELVLTYDSGTLKITRLGIPIGMPQILQIYERAFGADSLELAYVHYSFKTIKSIVPEEQYAVAETSLVTTAPLLYGAMPNLPLYTKPDGPCPNAPELLPMGKIKEAQEAQEEAAEYAIRDMVFVSSGLYEAGADGIDFDTTAAAGDAEFYATLKATEMLRQKYPDMAIEIGMAGEFVLGFHGQIEYDGVRLAGLYPHQQVKLAEKAGASIFGAVVNTNSSKSFPWNLGRAVTFCKACVEAAAIPVHANVGMGVGAVPLVMTPPIDCVSRVSTAMAEVARLDGLQVGYGDPAGMALAHMHASGMGGIRTAGDLVARLQMSRKMRLREAKEYVAAKLKVSVEDLVDEVVMGELRQELDISTVYAGMGEQCRGIESKFRIADLLGIEINSVRRFERKIKWH